jgi:hypothetical protein
MDEVMNQNENSRKFSFSFNNNEWLPIFAGPKKYLQEKPNFLLGFPFLKKTNDLMA